SFTQCNDQPVTALMAQELSAIGIPPTLLPYGDFLTYERFIGVAHGRSVAAASDIALDVRRQLAGERLVRVDLAVDDLGLPGGRPHGIIVEGDVPLDAEVTTPVTHVELDRGASFLIPEGGTHTLLVERFGLPWTRTTFTADADQSVSVTLPAPGKVTLDVTIDGAPDHALVVVWPSDAATLEAVQADYLGHFTTCAPMLGHPYGADPSCNRVLVSGPTDLALPPGTYDFFSVAGPFTTLAAARGVVVPPYDGDEPLVVSLAVESLPLLRPGMLTADFHVHGSASFDSSIPDSDRVRAFLASRLDVIAATDHDQVHDYAEAMDALDAHDRMELLVGLETTGHILQPILESTNNPKVVGHWIVWPLPFDPEGPWRGAPWDEKALPGELFTRFEDAGWPADSGVIQLNHPWGGIQFGRDFGWATALEMDFTKPLTGDDVPEGHALFSATPAGSRYANDGYHVQEVMNGTDNGQFEQYRKVWHYLLNEGVARGGTANSDSHTLGGNILGFPQNVVLTRQAVGTFDQPTFNAAVRAGRISGTTGPVLEARLEAGDNVFEVGVDRAHAPNGTVVVEVSAAPWVPVTELRVIVNGEVARTEAVTLQDDPVRLGVRTASFTFDVGGLVPAGSDAWLAFEAGTPLPLFADLSCDGMPDTGDNNGDGTVDWRDVDDYAELTSEPETEVPGCYDDYGPLRPDEGIVLPADDYRAVVPNGYPLSFTNPFLFDGDGDGAYTGVPR
ncbi:MAG: PHP domain-containing protein, partial [Myxococcales bacterium]|nr:PHP domain-containing protein [Myxococcales bacterium]